MLLLHTTLRQVAKQNHRCQVRQATMASYDLGLCLLWLNYHEMVTVPRALGSPSPIDDKPSAGMVLVIGDFGPKVEYIPFKQGSGASPSDVNM